MPLKTSLYPVFHFALNKSCSFCLSNHPEVTSCSSTVQHLPSRNDPSLIQPWLHCLEQPSKTTETTQSFLGLCIILSELLVPQLISNHLYSLGSWSGPLLIIQDSERLCPDPLQAPHDSDFCPLSFFAVPLLSLVQAVLPPSTPKTPGSQVFALVIGSPARNFLSLAESLLVSLSPPSGLCSNAPSYETFLQAPPTSTPPCPSPLCSLRWAY